MPGCLGSGKGQVKFVALQARSSGENTRPLHFLGGNMDVEQSAGIFAASDATEAGKKKKQSDRSIAEDRSIGHGENDLLGGEKVDAVLAAKMILVNDVGCHGRVGRCLLLR